MSNYRFNLSKTLSLKQPICHPLTATVALVLGSFAHATTFTVLNTNDSGTGSLREAVTNANASVGADNIVFDSALINSTITLTSGEIQISDELTITGMGDASSITIDGNNSTRLFKFNKQGLTASNQVETLTLENITLTGGKSHQGAALFSNRPVTLTNSIVTGNSLPAGLSSGAAITTHSDIVLNQSFITGNSNGAISAFDGNVTLNQSTLSKNSFGISTYQGTVTMNQSTISDNSGVGVSTFFGNALLNQSTVSGNFGTGVNAGYGRINLIQSTVSGNQGIGISVYDNSITLNQSTVTNNISGGIEITPYQDGSSRSSHLQITLQNTILSNNTGSGGNLIVRIPSRNNGTVTINAAFSLFGDAISEINGINISNIFTDSPGLRLLQNNGGPTQTHLPHADSPALDSGDNAEVSSTFDQRGSEFRRIVNGTVDIGAVERQAVASPANIHSIPMLNLPTLLSLIVSIIVLAVNRLRFS